MLVPHDKLVSFLTSQAIVWIPLLIGHQVRRQRPASERLAKPLHALNLSCITPAVYWLGMWRLDRAAPGWQWIPAVEVVLLVLMTVVPAWASFRFIKRRQTAGTFAIMIPISNTGYTMAGFLTLLLLAETGYSFNSLLMVPQVLFISTVWYPLAKHWGHGGHQSFMRSFQQALFSGQSMQMVGMLAGWLFNQARLPMGTGWVALLKIMVFGGTMVIAFAMGLKLRLRRLGGHQHLLAWVYLTKFLVCPLLMVGLCLATGLHGVAAGALLIAAAAPSGVNVVAFSTLFDLDVDLANAGYLWSTLLFMTVVLPGLIWALQQPFFK